ncbi:MAG: AIDA repeat-containing protein, partial [Lentisphaeria bacterium]|nr:AIDA repeat-containing protein [Lentisphaeria bacterium]
MARYDIYDGIISNGLTLSSGTSMYIFSGGTANSTTVNYWGEMYISSGGVANSTTVNSGGYMRIYSGGVANSTSVNSRGSMHISSGGIANSTTVNDLGWMFISSGGVANSTTVNDWGFMYISSGATANNTTVNSGGWMSISSGGTANSTTVNSGGWMSISSGGTATNVIWTPCVGLVSAADGAYVTYASKYSGVYFGSNDQLLSHTQSMSGKGVSGSMFVMSGGTANSTTVNSSGRMYISSGGTANTTTVNSRGWMCISYGGVHRGSLQIENGATVGAYSGAIIDFTVADRNTEDGCLINNLSLIQGAPTYTITVSAEQEFGTYNLAQGANSLTGTLTIGNGAVNYGSITVNGDDFAHNGKTYSLDQVDGNLTLTIDTLKTDGDLDGNGLADVVLVHTKQGYSGAWLTTGDASLIKWGDLGNVNSKVEVVGMGNVKGTTEEGSDIYLKIGTTVAAWTTEDGKVKSYKELYTLKSNMNMLGIADFNGDGVTDYLLRSTAGDLGYVTGNDNGWHYIKGLGKEWKIAAVGDLDGDGTDDVIVRHDAGFTGAYMIGTDGKITWSNLDTLSNDMTIVGTGDFNGDGVDDVLLQNKSNGWVGAWLVEDGSVDGFMGICKNTNSIEQIADFNGDGID